MRALYVTLLVPLLASAVPAFAQDNSSQDVLDILKKVLEDIIDEPDDEPSSREPLQTPGTATLNPLAEAAEEFLTETVPFDEDRRARVAAGQIWPICNAAYPEMEVVVAEQGQGPPVEQTREVKIAVDTAYVRQNLLHIGLDLARALAWSEQYSRERHRQDALTSEERTAAFNERRSPEHIVAAALNASNELPSVLPKVQDPQKCGHYAFLKRATPYRLVARPVGGRVFVLPRFGFRLCELRKIEPYNRQLCPDWIEVGGQPARLMGRYAVSAEWADGRRSRGIRDFTYLDVPEQTIELGPDGS